jgi:hypothetical protein
MTAKTTIDSIVRSIIIERGLLPHDYIRLLSFGLNCLKELDLDSIGKVRTVILKPDEFSRAPLPCDYVDWVRIGQPNGEYFIQFGPSNKLFRNKQLVDGQYIPRESVTIGWDSPYVHGWFDYNYHRPNFGGNPPRGDEFMILEEQEQIQFKVGYTTGDEIVMDYIYFDKTSASSNVHKYAEECIKAYMEWKYLSWMPKVQAYDKAEAKRAWEIQRTILDRRLSDLTPEVVKRLFARRFSLVK